MRTKLLAAIILGMAIVGLLVWVKPHDQSATIDLTAPNRVNTGSTFEVPLLISVVQAINAGEFYFNFPADKLTIKEIKKDGSFFTLWIKDSPSFDNQAGSLALAGGLPSPGFTGNNGLVATIVFEAKALGQAKISLDAKSRILANDGSGTQVKASFVPKTISIR